MNKIAKKNMIISNIVLLLISIAMIILTLFMQEHIIWIIFGIVFLFIGIKCLKFSYESFIEINRKSIFRNNQLTEEEQEIVEDAKRLIKSVDENIIISDFNVYKVKFLSNGMFYYDNDTHELNIFIPFGKYMKWSKDLCFIAVLHEVLHSQNLKTNLRIFDNRFLEGLNQLLTIWIIETYSQKYKIPESICITKIKIGKRWKLRVNVGYKIYEKEVDIVKNVLDNSEIDMKELFLNYIDFNPQFFKDFVPERYFNN